MLAKIELLPCIHRMKDTDPTAPPPMFNEKTVMTIAQRNKGMPWRMGLAHARPHRMAIWVTRGAAKAVVDARDQNLGSHNALFVPAGTLFSFQPEGGCFGQTLVLPVMESLNWPDGPMLLRVREPQAQLTLTGYFEAIQVEARAAGPMSDVAISAHAQLMMVWAQRYQGPGAGMQRSTAARRVMRAFCALIVQSEGTDLSGAPMAKFAARLGVTPTHLTRVCKAECGMTAADLLTQFTLQRARRLLEKTTKPAAHISKELGFSNPAYFTRFIKTHTGLPPSQLRDGPEIML
jgi:AraC family transcriptional activator of pobA